MAGLIIEGVDGAGKTGLATEMAERGYKYVHVASPKTDKPADEYLALMHSIPWRTPVVFDRMHLGERVYGPIDRGESRMSDPEYRAVEAMMIDRNYRLLWLDTDPQECYDRCKAADESRSNDPAQPNDKFWPVERFYQLSKKYEEVVAQSYLPRVHIKNWGEGAMVIGPADENTDRIDLEGWGSNKPKIWVLGDGLNPFGPFYDKLGLAQVWPVIDPRIHRVTQVHPADQIETVAEVWRRWVMLGRPRIITLGHGMDEACTAALLGHTALPEPGEVTVLPELDEALNTKQEAIA